jgi:hypothetical protein
MTSRIGGAFARALRILVLSTIVGERWWTKKASFPVIKED